jgi:hypothetical protein
MKTPSSSERKKLMLSISISKIVNQIVKHALLSNTERKEGEGLYLSFDCGLGHYTNSNSFSSRCGLHLVYHCLPGMTYVDVFSMVTNSPFAKVKDFDGSDFTHEVTHDSCWRDIEIFSSLYFGMAREINEKMKAAGLPEVAPGLMTDHSSFQLFDDNLWKWIPIKVKKDPAEHYRKTLEIHSVLKDHQ